MDLTESPLAEHVLLDSDVGVATCDERNSSRCRGDVQPKFEKSKELKAKKCENAPMNAAEILSAILAPRNWNDFCALRDGFI